MVAFLVDTQLPPILSDFLKSHQLDSKHTVMDYEGGHLLTDRQVISIALNESRIVITKDKDFKDYFDVKGSPPRIIYLQLGNCSNRELLNYFRRNLSGILDLLRSEHSFIVAQTERLIAY